MQDILKREVFPIGMKNYYIVKGDLEYVEDWVDIKMQIPKNAHIDDPEYPKCNECGGKLSIINKSNYRRKCCGCGSRFMDMRYKLSNS